MALITADRVLETSTTTGTITLVLAGAVAGYRTFGSVCATTDTCYYYIAAVNSSGVPTGDWETGFGTWTTGGNLARTIVHASSNAGAAVSFAAGTKYVSIAQTAAAVQRGGLTFSDGPSFIVAPQMRNNGTTMLESTVGASSTGTATGRATTSSTLFANINRIGYVGAGGAQNEAGLDGQAVIGTIFALRPAVAEFVFGVSDAIASGTKTQVGFVNSLNGVASGQEPNSDFYQSRIIMAARSTDSQFVVMHNDDSGTPTVVTLNGGAGFPCNTNSADLYKFRVEYYPTSDPGGRRFVYTATNLSTNVSATGVLTTNIPAAADTIYFVCKRGSGASATAAAIDVASIAAGRYV